MVVATTSPPLTLLVWTLILHFHFVHAKGDITAQREELRDGDCSLLTLSQPCRIFQHCPLLYGLCFYHAMSNFFYYSALLVVGPAPCFNPSPTSMLSQSHHALTTHKTNLRPLLNHQHINLYF